MSVSPVSNSTAGQALPAPEIGDNGQPVKAYTGNTEVDGMIADGTASVLYGCTTTQEILDRLTGKTKDAEGKPSSAAASTMGASAKAGLW